MYEEQARINATISYFFLGPIFLLARNGSPLTDPYVRIHAKRSSFIMLLGSLGYIAYYLLKPLLVWSLFGILLSTIVLGVIMSTMVGYLMFYAYKAYNGDSSASEVTISSANQYIYSIDLSEKSDAEKIRIIASFVPLLGTWLSSKYPDSNIFMGRKIGSFVFFLILSSSFFLDGSTGLSLILILLLIILIVSSGVICFTTGNFPVLSLYRWIPSYIEFETHIRTIFMWCFAMLRVLGGSDSITSYTDLYNINLSKIPTGSYQESLPLPPQLIGIPVINLIALPFLFQKKFNAYYNIILQGCIVTIFCASIWFFSGFGSEIQLFLLFPIIHIISFAHISPYTRAPVVDIIVWMRGLFGRGKQTIEEIKTKEEVVSYNYTNSEE